MSSKNAVYESSVLRDFGAVDGPGLGFTIEGAAGRSRTIDVAATAEGSWALVLE